MNEPIVTRTAAADDLERIMAVQIAAGRTSSDGFRAVTEQSIHDPAALVLVATQGARLVGWATTHRYPEPDGAAPAGHYLMGVTVTPAMRRRGIATRLIAERLAWIGRRTDRAYYFTNARNAASIASHERWGFRELARAASFRGVPFDGGEGVLFSADLR